MKTNWRKGLLRLWLVGSVLWIVSVGAVLRVDTAAWTYWELRDLPQRIEREISGESSLTPEEQALLLFEDAPIRHKDAKERLLIFAGISIVSPLFALAFGSALVWAARGFKSNT